MRTALAVAVALWSSIAPPASGDDAERVTGFLCGYVSTNDPTGVVDSDPHQQHGWMDAGPITVRPADPGDPVLSVTVTCSIQVNEEAPSSPDDVTVTGTGTVVAYLPPTGMTYRAAPGDNVYVCGRVEWTTQHGQFALDWDYDWSTAGTQCCLVFCDQPFPDLGKL